MTRKPSVLPVPSGDLPSGASGTEPACQCRRRERLQVQSLGGEDPLEEGTATHSSILAWRIPWTEQPGGPRGHSVGHDSSDSACTHVSAGRPCPFWFPREPPPPCCPSASFPSTCFHPHSPHLARLPPLAAPRPSLCRVPDPTCLQLSLTETGAP